jgi:methylmalonyl-CoA/ethylmalonyl-CoA epimerase
MSTVTRIDHVAYLVPDIDAALASFAALGIAPGARELVASQKTEACLLPIADGNIELISPAGNESLQRFLDKRGPGLHHVALEVENIEAALADLEAKGLPLIDKTPRIGARGHKVAFVHPKAFGGLLVELVEASHHG